MSGWSGRRVVLGVSGSIAAYKAIELASRLRQAGAILEVILTRGAAAFVTPGGLGAVAGGPVHSPEAPPNEYGPRHLEILARNEAVLVAPASANLLARAANGLADELLTTVLLAAQVPVVYAPAMETGMYLHPATQENLARLRSFGARVVEPEEGFLASGARGLGRLAEPGRLLQVLAEALRGGADLSGLTFLITAGPTREHLDPVRFLSNPSTGRMGYALASVARLRGATVILVSGPTELPPPFGVRVERVISAQEMAAAVASHWEGADVVIGAAAVADHRPARFSPAKRPKAEQTATLELLENPDIIGWVGERKGRRLVVGFAAETGGDETLAQAKLARKHLDLLVQNDVTDPEAGFAKSTNRVRLFYADGRTEGWPLLSKEEVAGRLLDRIVAALPVR